MTTALPIPLWVSGCRSLTSTAKLVLKELAERWAWGKPCCWPADTTIANAVGRSVGTVQRALRSLERLGLIIREATPSVPNGRKIWLRWRALPVGTATDPDHRRAAPARIKRGESGPVGPSSPTDDKSVDVDADALSPPQEETGEPARAVPDGAPAPPASPPPLAAPASRQEPVAVLSQAPALAGNPAGVDRVAAQLYGWLGSRPDARGDFLGKLRQAVQEVSEGRAPVGRLVACYRKASGSPWARSKAAVFIKWWSRGLGDTVAVSRAAATVGGAERQVRSAPAASGRPEAASVSPPATVEELRVDLVRVRELARRFGGGYLRAFRELEARLAAAGGDPPVEGAVALPEPAEGVVVPAPAVAPAPFAASPRTRAAIVEDLGRAEDLVRRFPHAAYRARLGALRSELADLDAAAPGVVYRGNTGGCLPGKRPWDVVPLIGEALRSPGLFTREAPAGGGAVSRGNGAAPGAVYP